MFKHLSPTYKAILLVLIAYANFSVSDAAVKYLTSYYSTYQIITLTMLMSCMALFAFASKMGGFKSLCDRRNAKIHLVRGLANCMGALLFVFFLSIMPITAVYTVGFLMPFMVTLIAIPLYKEKVGWHRWLSMAIGFSGVLIAFRPWDSTLDPLQLLLLMGVPLCFAITHGVMRSMKGASDLAISFYPLAIPCILTAPLLLIEGNYTALELAHIPIFAISGICITIALTCISRAFHMADASLISPTQYTQIIWGIIFGAVIFGDFPDRWMIAGAVVIIASGVYLVRREHVVHKRQSLS